MPDESPQGNVTTAESAPDSVKEDWTGLAGNLLEGEPETENEEEEVADDSSEEEPEEEPDEGDTDDEDDADEDASGQPRDEKGRFVSDQAKITLENGDVVTIAEAKQRLREADQGGLRQADYTRKTQALADDKRATEERARAVEQLESQYAQQLEQAQTILEAYQTPPPDPSIIHSDPLGYMQQKAAYDDWNARWNYVQQERQGLTETQKKKQETETQKRIARESELLAQKVPELLNPDKYRAYEKDLDTYAPVWGFASREEMKVPDHRAHLVFRDAIAYRKLQAQKPKAQDKAKGKPPVTPGRRQDAKSNDARALQRDLQTLESTRGHGQAGSDAWERALKRSGHI